MHAYHGALVIRAFMSASLAQTARVLTARIALTARMLRGAVLRRPSGPFRRPAAADRAPLQGVELTGEAQALSLTVARATASLVANTAGGSPFLIHSKTQSLNSSLGLPHFLTGRRSPISMTSSAGQKKYTFCTRAARYEHASYPLRECHLITPPPWTKKLTTWVVIAHFELRLAACCS